MQPPGVPPDVVGGPTMILDAEVEVDIPSAIIVVNDKQPTSTLTTLPTVATPIDQNQNRLKDKEKDHPLRLLNNVRKVYISRCSDPQTQSNATYKVMEECGSPLFFTSEEPPASSCPLLGKYFSRSSNRLVELRSGDASPGDAAGGPSVLKLDFGRSRSFAVCQTFRFAAISGTWGSSEEETPLAIVFKDRGCCLYSCCSSAVTYETLPQADGILPFTVATHRHWKNRTEFMLKHSNGSILGFIDKEKAHYTLTMGEGIKPPMKATLIAFVITMDMMDREDVGALNCYLRPSTYVTLLFLLMLFLMIGAFLYHFVTAMVLAWPRTDRPMGCQDPVHDVIGGDSDTIMSPPISMNHSHGDYNNAEAGVEPTYASTVLS